MAILCPDASANIIGAEGANFTLEVQRVECLDDCLACFDLLRDGAGGFQVKHDLVGVGCSGLRHHLHAVPRHRKLAATDHESACDDHLGRGGEDVAVSN